MKKISLSILLCVLSAASLQASPNPHKPKTTQKAKKVSADSVTIFKLAPDSLNRTFQYQTGHIKLPGGVGGLTVPRGFRYLDSAQSSYVLHKLWHNPPQANLGMLFPLDATPLGAKNWGYIITYEPIGYVQDSDDANINYDKLLQTMQKATAAANAARTAAGYDAVYLAGWGARPHYDKQQHTLHWAKFLRSGSGFDRTINYNVRVLGRRGVLIFNAVADPSRLPEIQASVPDLLANVQFARGEQYRDFNPATDGVAAYSISSLVAGKELAKVVTAALLSNF